MLEKLEREQILSRESRDERTKRYQKFNSEKEAGMAIVLLSYTD